QGEVFLGDSLVSGKSYSEETAHKIDAEVEQILRDAQQRCRQLLTENRYGLDLVARSLLEHETIDGAEVTRLIELAVKDGPPSDDGNADDGNADDAVLSSSES
ncbi:MAG: ATP-dependent zinc metalloprotease FtsH, partial [Acidimicrobiales bacterium]